MTSAQSFGYLKMYFEVCGLYMVFRFMRKYKSWTCFYFVLYLTVYSGCRQETEGEKAK